MATLARQEALAVSLEALPESPVIVSLGTTSREVLALRNSDCDLHVLDSMGLNAAIGLGLALGIADRCKEKVLVLEGDGGLLMGLATLATIGLLQPTNLIVVVLDDGTYSATGGQRTASTAVDFADLAAACGIQAHRATTVEELRRALASSRAARVPALVAVKITAGRRSRPFYLPDPPVLTDRFLAFLDRLTASG